MKKNLKKLIKDIYRLSNKELNLLIEELSNNEKNINNSDRMSLYDFALGVYDDIYKFIGKTSIIIDGKKYISDFNSGFKDWELDNILFDQLKNNTSLIIGEMDIYYNNSNNINYSIIFYEIENDNLNDSVYVAINYHDDRVFVYNDKEDMFESILSEFSPCILNLGTSGDARKWFDENYINNKPDGFWAVKLENEYDTNNSSCIYLLYPELENTTPNPAFVTSGIYKGEDGNLYDVAWNNTNVKVTDFPEAILHEKI